MKNPQLDRAAELVSISQHALIECPPQYRSAEALAGIRQAIEELKKAQADINSPTSQRWELSWTKWYKEIPPRLFHRWDDAFTAAVLQMSLLFTEFTVRMTGAAPDGESLEWTVSADSETTLVVRRKT